MDRAQYREVEISRRELRNGNQWNSVGAIRRPIIGEGPFMGVGLTPPRNECPWIRR